MWVHTICKWLYVACLKPFLDRDVRWSNPAHALRSYNLQDFCPTEELGGYTLQEWEASMAPLPDGSLPRMDALLHRNPTTTAAKCADVQGLSPLGVIQQWCGVDRSMFQWLSQPSVVSALHVTTPKGTETNNLKYTGGYRGGDLRSLYKELALKYRLWIYNGQEDGCIPYTGAEVRATLLAHLRRYPLKRLFTTNFHQEWTSHLGFPIKTSWHPWFGDAAAGGSRVAAGYAVQYDSPARDFQFVTVKGAGHEVAYTDSVFPARHSRDVFDCRFQPSNPRQHTPCLHLSSMGRLCSPV